MEIQLVRSSHKPWGIDGRVYINYRYVCDSVEHPTYRKSAGVYRIDLETNPFRHGDGALGSKKGEIIVGKQLMPGLVTQSQQTYDRLYERLKKAFQRGNSVRLRIEG